MLASRYLSLFLSVSGTSLYPFQEACLFRPILGIIDSYPVQGIGFCPFQGISFCPVSGLREVTSLHPGSLCIAIWQWKRGAFVLPSGLQPTSMSCDMNSNSVFYSPLRIPRLPVAARRLLASQDVDSRPIHGAFFDGRRVPVPGCQLLTLR